MKSIRLFLLPSLLLLLISCGPSRDHEFSKIQSAEKRLFTPSATFSKEGADSLLGLYSQFIRDFPKDSLTRKYIFKSGNLYMTRENGPKAIEMFDLYMKNYPADVKTPMCLFFKAFIYENIFHNLDKAQETYILFIEKYPRHDFADDARMALQNLGKTADQMVAEFEAKKKADDARVADSLKKAGKKKK